MFSKSFTCSSDLNFAEFLECHQFKLKDNVDYGEFAVSTVAQMSKENLMINFHFDEELADEIYDYLSEQRKEFKKSKNNSKSAIQRLKSLFRNQNEKSTLLKFEDYFINPDESEINKDDPDVLPMDIVSAANSSNPQVFETIVKNQAKKLRIAKNQVINQPGTEGWTILMNASMLGKVQLVKYLLENNAEMKTRNNAGQTALMIAASFGHFLIIKLLAENGLRKAKLFKNNVPEEMMKNEILLNFADNQGWTALHFAVYFNHLHAVKLLLKYGADSNFSDNDGMTPTLIACQNTNTLAETVCLMELIKNGGKITIQNNKRKNGLDLTCYPNRILEAVKFCESQE